LFKEASAVEDEKARRLLLPLQGVLLEGGGWGVRIDKNEGTGEKHKI